MRAPRSGTPLLVALALVGWALAASGCGHPASTEECTVILDKTAELTLRSQNISDPNILSERIAAFREARGEELLAKCKGRNITESALACVKRAESPAEVDRCLY